MSVADSLIACESNVRRNDPDRYFSALFAPSEKRPLLFALYAFNHELARIGEIVHQPMIGEIRLQWWRETVERARIGDPPAHDVARALAELFEQTRLPVALVAQMVDARAFDFSADAFPDQAACDTYLDATSGNIMRLAAAVLAPDRTFDELAREAGIAYGLAGLLRSQAHPTPRKKLLITDLAYAVAQSRSRFEKARSLSRSNAALPAFLPAALVPPYLKSPGRNVPLYRKQLVLLRAGMRGRL